MELAKHFKKGPLHAGWIASRQGISVKYLEQLIIPLKRARLVVSSRGPKGGHRLAREPADIAIGAIVRVLEGQESLLACIDDPDSCERSATCETRRLWREANEAFFERLDALTLESLIEQCDGDFDCEKPVRRVQGGGEASEKS
jgi:Rrf2 family protein